MKLSTEESGNPLPLLPKGLHHAVLTSIIDYGTQESEYEGQKRTKRECRIEFTLPNVTHVFDESRGPEPRKKSVFCTLSAHPKAKLHEILTSITGKGLPSEIDLSDYIGQNGFLYIIHEEGKQDKKLRDKIGTYDCLGENDAVISDLPTKLFVIDDFDKEVFLSLGEKEQAIIKRSPEFKAIQDNPYLAE